MAVTRPEAHIRHAGLIIDASFRKDGSVDYYVVEGSHGRFYTLEAAKEIAEHRAVARMKAGISGPVGPTATGPRDPIGREG